MGSKEVRDKLFEIAIPSDYMRAFYCSVGRDFTDFELAAMIWNSRKERAEILKLIEELAGITTDSVLREQIEGRLRHEKEKYRFFSDNEDGSCVYTVEYEDEEWSCGFFRMLDRAIEYAKKDGKRRFSIGKQLIVEDELPVQKVGEWNPNLFPGEKDEFEEYEGRPIATADYSPDGRLTACWSYNLPDGVTSSVDNWSTDRFENYPLILENPFEKGDIVMDGDAVGVIDITKEELRDSNERIKNGEYADYFDATTTIVQYIEKNGRIRHGHPSLLFLKKMEEKDLPPDMSEYAGIVSSLIKGEYSLDFFLLEYEKRIANADVKERDILSV